MSIKHETDLKLLIDTYKGMKSTRDIRKITKTFETKYPGFTSTLIRATDMDFYPTPLECLDHKRITYQLKDAQHILEPSAGFGSIMYSIYKKDPNVQITAFEYNTDFSNFLKGHFPKATIYNEDFLENNKSLSTVDIIMCNPPFTRGNDKKYYYNFYFKCLDIMTKANIKTRPTMIFICPLGGLQKSSDRDIKNERDPIPSEIFDVISYNKIKNICDMLNIRHPTKKEYKLLQDGEAPEYDEDTNPIAYLQNLLPYNISSIGTCKFKTTGMAIGVYIVEGIQRRYIEEPEPTPILKPKPKPKPKYKILLSDIEELEKKAQEEEDEQYQEYTPPTFPVPPPEDLIKYLNGEILKSSNIPVPYYNVDSVYGYFLLHILKKNNNDCYIKEDDRFLMTGRTSLDRPTNKLIEDIATSYMRCKKRKKMLVMLLLVDDGTHANMLIFNYHRNEIERFEPHGKETGNDAGDVDLVESIEIDKSIQKLLVNRINKHLPVGEKLVYVPATEVCPDNFDNYQAYEGLVDGETAYNKQVNTYIRDPAGYCLAWSFFYADLRMKFPKLSAASLIEASLQIITIDPTKLQHFIRGQMTFLYDFLAEALKYTGLNINNFFKKYHKLGKKFANSKTAYKFYRKWEEFIKIKLKEYTEHGEKQELEFKKFLTTEDKNQESEIKNFMKNVHKEQKKDRAEDNEKYIPPPLPKPKPKYKIPLSEIEEFERKADEYDDAHLAEELKFEKYKLQKPKPKPKPKQVPFDKKTRYKELVSPGGMRPKNYSPKIKHLKYNDPDNKYISDKKYSWYFIKDQRVHFAISSPNQEDALKLFKKQIDDDVIRNTESFEIILFQHHRKNQPPLQIRLKNYSINNNGGMRYHTSNLQGILNYSEYEINKYGFDHRDIKYIIYYVLHNRMTLSSLSQTQNISTIVEKKEIQNSFNSVIPKYKIPLSDIEEFEKKADEYDDDHLAEELKFEKYLNQLKKKTSKQKQHTKSIQPIKQNNKMTKKIIVDNGNITFKEFMNLFGANGKASAPLIWFKTRDPQDTLHKKISKRFDSMKGLLNTYRERTAGYVDNERAILYPIVIPTNKEELKQYDYIVNDIERMLGYIKKFKLPKYGSTAHLSNQSPTKQKEILIEIKKDNKKGVIDFKKASEVKKEPEEKKEPKEKKEKKVKKEKKQTKLSEEKEEIRREVAKRKKEQGYTPEPQAVPIKQTPELKINVDKLIPMINAAYVQKNNQNLGLTRKKIISEKIDKQNNIILHVKNITVDDYELIDVIRLTADDDMFIVSLEQMHNINKKATFAQYEEFAFEI